jgi:queuine tRNA-ribosyltransferase
MPFSFSIKQKLKGTRARAGVIHTPHGDILTPAFIAVGTKATVKALTPETLIDIGAQAVLANTYHLYLQPGQEIIKKAGGFAPFMNWNGPTMTDSGGFQVFSLGSAYDKGKSKIGNVPADLVSDLSTSPHASLAKIDENGVAFASIIDGSAHYFTPEKSIQIQHDLGADIIVAFDECTAPDDPYEYQREAMERTHRWAKRSLEEHRSKEQRLKSKNDNVLLTPNNTSKSKLPASSQRTQTQALYGVIQGGKFEDLRKESARTISEMTVESDGGGFEGFCIGGSFDKDDIYKAVEWVTDILPQEKPRHLLGMGEVIDLFEGVERGIDTFDCVSPTRLARNGALYTRRGRINILNAEFAKDFSPIDAECRCPTCTNYSRAYIAHLFRAREILASVLASQHNLFFIVNLVKEMRERILDGTFPQLKKDFLAKYYARV